MHDPLPHPVNITDSDAQASGSVCVCVNTLCFCNFWVKGVRKEKDKCLWDMRGALGISVCVCDRE